MAPKTRFLTVFVEASFRHLSCRETKAQKQRRATGRRLASRAIVRHPHRPPRRPRDGVSLARRFAPVGLVFPDSLSRRFHARLFLLLALRPLRDPGRRAGEQPLLPALPMTPARGWFSRPPCPPATPGTLANGSANQKLDQTPVWALRQGYRWCRGFRQRTRDVWVHSLDMRGCTGWDRGPPDVSEFHPRALGMGPYLDTASFGWNRIKMKPHLMRAGPTPVTGVLTRQGRGGHRRAAGTMCGEDARGGGRGTRRRRSGRRGPRQAGAAGGPPGAGGEAWAGWASDARREPAPHTSVCRPERQCRAERGSQTVPFLPPHRPANVGLAYTERPTRPRLSPRRPRGRWVFQLRGGD